MGKSKDIIENQSVVEPVAEPVVDTVAEPVKSVSGGSVIVRLLYDYSSCGILAKAGQAIKIDSVVAGELVLSGDSDANQSAVDYALSQAPLVDFSV